MIEFKVNTAVIIMCGGCVSAAVSVSGSDCAFGVLPCCGGVKGRARM